MSLDEKKQKSRLAAHDNNINIVLLLLVLVLMTVVALVIINNISKDNAKDYVRVYSLEAANQFYSYINQDLTLVRKASHSAAIKEWFADEEDEVKKARAYDEIMSYFLIVPITHLHFGIQKSFNEYSFYGDIKPEDMVPVGRINQTQEDGSWYTECIGSDNEYTLTINYEKTCHLWHLWINHKVVGADGTVAGVFCSGLRIPDVFHDIFDETKYNEKNVRGYIIDRYGVIQSDSTAPDVYKGSENRHILEESIDPVFAAALAAYESRISGFFGSHSVPELVTLGKGAYKYAAIEPIEGTNWSVVIFLNGSTLTGYAHLLPLLGVMFMALLVYVLGRNTLISSLIFTPLNRLIRSVAAGDTIIVGSDRDDEIGDLARSIREMEDLRQRQGQLLHAVNSTAAVLLSPVDEEDFSASLLEGLEFIGHCVDVDRVHIWRNETIDGEFCYVNQYRWVRNDNSGWEESPSMRRYSEIPEWERRFLRNECINGPISTRTQEEKDILIPQGVKTILAIPLYWHTQFYGFFSFDDSRKERTFTDDEINILRSAGLMIISAVNRSTQAADLREAHERSRLMLDAMPLACRLWDKNFHIFEYNEESIKLFDLKEGQGFADSYFDLSPEYQPDGQLSRKKAIDTLKKAFEEGRYVTEWMNQTLDGRLIPTEVTLVRLKYGDDYVIAGYTRDLREQKQMMNEIGRRDKLLHIVNSTATVLLSPIDEDDFVTSLQEGMELIGHYVDVDRIIIWQNDTINGEFCYTKQFQWLRTDDDRRGRPAVAMRFYKENPEWERKFLRNEYVNGPVAGLTAVEQAILGPQGVKSILAIPLYWNGNFYGFFSFDDCHLERTFTVDEADILHSAGLMIVSALNRNAQTELLREVHEHNKIMLNAIPHACSLWRKDGSTFDCNEAVISFFNIDNKKQFLTRFNDLSPEYQPDGSRSSEAAIANVKKAFEEGKCIFKWMHQEFDGTPIPAEVTLVRVPYEDEYVVAGYMRDLREHEQMMSEIEQRDNLLNSLNKTASVLLASEGEEDFKPSLLKGMEFMGNCLDVDRVQIWRNEEIDGNLHFIHTYQWLSEFGREAAPVPINLKFPYSDMPEWEAMFLRGEYINGPWPSLPEDEQKFLKFYDIKSIVILPLFLQNQFWGFFSVDDCQTERTFTDDEIDIIRSGSLMMVSALNRNIQATRLRQANQHTQLLLDAMPFACNLWDKNFNVFGCNEENVRLFGLKDKQEFVDHFQDLSPEYQPDGRLSLLKTEFVSKAFSEGSCVFKWMHQKRDGTPIPTEVTLVRVAYDNDHVVAGYIRDLREQNVMIEKIERTAYLLSIVNQMATILLRPDISEFEEKLQQCMSMLGEAVSADRISIWKNSTINGKLHCTEIYEWVFEERLRTSRDISTNVPYEGNIPTWEALLTQGECINSLTRDLPPVEQARMSMHGVLSIFAAPVFMHDEFWGFVGCDDCQEEKVLSDNEVSILRSGSMLIASALQRHDMTLNIQTTTAKLKAVIASYAGIIWCVDLGHIITLFDGQYLNELGSISSNFEGRRVNEALQDRRFTGIIECIDNSFASGPQDLTIDVDGKTFRIRSTPVYDDLGNVTNIMGTFDDVSERTRLQEELKNALIEAQDANEAKTNFLASMSHEMRTPLNAVIGLSELALESDGLNDEVSMNLEKIYNAGATLLSTVNDILDISKIEAGRLELIPIEYDTSSLLNDAITQSIMRKGEKPIQFDLDISENLPTHLCGDDLRIKQILNNLMSNAFKYTDEGTVKLFVNCERDGDSVWMTISVSDTGKGIKTDDINNLFNDYSQIDIIANRKIEGTGLGLSITKKIAEMMDGSISVESEYGKGSVFTVKVRQKFVTSDIIGAEVVRNLKESRYSDNKRNQNSRLNRIRLPYARVLVVDDVSTNLDVAKGMLKTYGMLVDCVGSGQDAINAIRAEKVKYNAVFMDHMMPGMDGLEATRIIREEIDTDYARNVPIIALTANAILGNEQLFLSRGFQAFLSKPIDVSRLDSIVHEYVRDKEQEKLLADKLYDSNGDTVYGSRSGDERRSGFDRRHYHDVSGLDVEKGLRRFGSDGESYMRVLNSFMVNTPPLLDKIRRINKDDLENYAITVHGIKGSSRGIGADAVGDMAEALEEAAKSGDFEFIAAATPGFLKATDKLIGDLGVALARMVRENPKEKKDKPDRETLIKLMNACEKYQMDGVDEAMTELEKYQYDTGGDFVEWLRENTDQMNFVQIIETLSEELHE